MPSQPDTCAAARLACSPRNIGRVVYDAASLQFEDMQQPSWKASCTVSGHFVSAQDRELQHLQHLGAAMKSCRSLIVKQVTWWNFTASRNLTCMLLFWLGAMNTAQMALSTCPDHIRGTISAAQQQRLHQQFMHGQLYILADKLLRCQQLLTRAQSLATSLMNVSDSTMLLATVPTFQRPMDVSQLLSSDVAVADLNIIAQVGVGNLGVFDIDDVELDISMIHVVLMSMTMMTLWMKVTLKRTSRADRVHVAAQ